MDTSDLPEMYPQSLRTHVYKMKWLTMKCKINTQVMEFYI